MASALMAMEDFNHRDPYVVKQLADDEYDLDQCDVYFPLPWDYAHTSTNNGTNVGDARRFASVVKDDGDREDTTANALLSTLSRMRDTPADLADDEYNAQRNHGLCAVAGSIRSLPARTASTLAAASDVPYLSHAADTTKISRPPLYPLSGKTSADEYARGDAIISYLASIGRDKVILAYSHTNEDVLKVTSRAARDHGVELRYEPVGPPWDGTGPDTPYYAMKRIKESGFKTVILEISRLDQWEHIAREAERFGVNTDEYVWFVWETVTDMNVLTKTRTSPGSEMDKLLRGMGSVRVLDGYDWQEDNKFLARWKSRDWGFVERLNSMNPIKIGNKEENDEDDERLLQKANGGRAKGGDGGAPGYFRAEPDYFQQYLPMQFSSFMYDTVIALGMGACRAQKIRKQIAITAAADKDEEIDGSGQTQSKQSLFSEVATDARKPRRGSLQGPDMFRPGKNLQFNETVKVTFDGASGFVKLDNGMIFARDEGTLAFGVYNIRAVDVIGSVSHSLEEGGDPPPEATRGYEYAITAKKIPGGMWAEVPGEPFIYADGTSTQPTPVREVFDNNFLSPAARAGGFALFAVGAFICVGLAAWTFANRKSSIIRAAQPEFLCLLCFGSLASLVTIVMLSFDESYGTSVETLSGMCTSTPWLVFTGYIIVYMVLFSKLRRINSVLQFRRREVKAHHVILPAIALVLLAFVILALWTALDPWIWVRETINDETGETFGKCASNNATAYLVPLVLLMLIATLLAAAMAYKTRDIDNKFSEAGPIFVGIVTQLEVWVVGIPILVIVENVSADAQYLGRVLTIWTFAVTMVLTVICPKFLNSQGCCLPSNQSNRRSHLTCGNGTVRVTGLSNPYPASRTTNTTLSGPRRSSKGRHSGRRLSAKFAISEVAVLDDGDKAALATQKSSEKSFAGDEQSRAAQTMEQAPDDQVHTSVPIATSDDVEAQESNTEEAHESKPEQP